MSGVDVLRAAAKRKRDELDAMEYDYAADPPKRESGQPSASGYWRSTPSKACRKR